MDRNNKKNIIIIGAGPAGLSAALNILRLNSDINLTIIEQEKKIGGLSRTISNNGNSSDIGPHRFFTKNPEVWKLWTEFLAPQRGPAKDDILCKRDFFNADGLKDPEKEDKVFLKRKRFSRIYYQNNFFDYPLKIQTIFKLGLKTTFLIGTSYIKSCFFKRKEPNLEAFMINRFGKTLYELFFEDYTEKVWGIHPKDLSDKWGAQRIKGISLFRVLWDFFTQIFHLKKQKETSLIDEYYYPKLGCSQMWHLMLEEINNLGGKILLNQKVIGLTKTGNNITSVKITNNQTKEEQNLNCDILVSSMPIKELLTQTNDVPSEIRDLAQNLQYRDFILVTYVIKKLNLKNNTSFSTVDNMAPDSWIYLQDKNIKAGRLDIVNSFSPYLIKNFPNESIINMEYFCYETDDFYQKSDAEIIAFATEELNKLQAVDNENIITANVNRIKKAYPSYCGSYEHFDKIKAYINSIKNLYCIGRNGQHKYNNMDHSISDGIEIAKILKNNLDKSILWDLNTESEYQEEK